MWQAVVEFINEARTRYWVAIAVASGLILGIPEPVASWLGLGLFGSGTPLGVVGLIFVVSTVFSLVGAYSWWEVKRAEDREDDLVQSQLATLTEGEATLLRGALEKQERTIFRNLTDTHARALVHKGLLETSDLPVEGKAPTPTRGWPHVIPDRVWEIMLANRDLLNRDSDGEA